LKVAKKHLEREAKFMETIKATVTEVDGKHYIEIHCSDEFCNISLSEDNPNEVKKSFNKLIEVLKEKKFQIQLEEIENNLFSQVANEYINQLNREILEVHGEMLDYGLIEE
jgi:hypothetical protein